MTVAQAFHWFELDRALPEIHRVLRPGGHLALFWNSRDLDDPLRAALERLLQPLRRSVVAQQEHDWRGAVEASPLFGSPRALDVVHAPRLGVEDLRARVASTSFVAALEPRERDALLDRVADLAAGLEQPFPFPYRTEVHVIPRADDRPPAAPPTSNRR